MIYYWITRRQQILMLTLYRKGEVKDLRRDEVRQLKQIIKAMES